MFSHMQQSTLCLHFRGIQWCCVWAGRQLGIAACLACIAAAAVDRQARQSCDINYFVQYCPSRNRQQRRFKMQHYGMYLVFCWDIVASVYVCVCVWSRSLMGWDLVQVDHQYHRQSRWPFFHIQLRGQLHQSQTQVTFALFRCLKNCKHNQCYSFLCHFTVTVTDVSPWSWDNFWPVPWSWHCFYNCGFNLANAVIELWSFDFVLCQWRQ